MSEILSTPEKRGRPKGAETKQVRLESDLIDRLKKIAPNLSDAVRSLLGETAPAMKVNFGVIEDPDVGAVSRAFCPSSGCAWKTDKAGELCPTHDRRRDVL